MCNSLAIQVSLPSRRAGAQDSPPRHQIQQHPYGPAVERQGVGFRARQASLLGEVLRHHSCHGDVRVSVGFPPFLQGGLLLLLF
jgi:hypothetical protein